MNQSQEGNDMRVAARLSISLCAYSLKNYSAAIEECERVLEMNPSYSNVWAVFMQVNRALETDPDNKELL